MGKSADSIAVRQRVHRQMLDRFPARAVDWVKQVRWTGPVKMSTENINSEGREKWKASHDPKRSPSDPGNPIVLVRGPNGNINIVDGHHRFLAAEAAGRPVRAWLAEVPRDTGPWSETHSAQKGGPSS